MEICYNNMVIGCLEQSYILVTQNKHRQPYGRRFCLDVRSDFKSAALRDTPQR